MLVALLLLLLTPLPSASRTTWMRPESFHLTVGMSRLDALKALSDLKLNAKRGRSSDEFVVDYTDDKALTIEFQKDRLTSIRFEYFAFISEAREAFGEQRKMLQKDFGKPRVSSPSTIIYDNALPNVMVVLSADPKTENGKKGLGFVAVRYYDPR